MKNNEMTQHIAQWSKSGLSKSAYCKENGIVYHTFLYYIKSQADTADSVGFTLLKPAKSKNSIEFHLPNGSWFSLPSDCPMLQDTDENSVENTESD